MGYSWITILDILTLIYNQYGLLIPQNLGKNEICLKKPYIIPMSAKITPTNVSVITSSRTSGSTAFTVDTGCGQIKPPVE